MNLKIYFLLFTSVTLADNDYDEKTDGGYSLDQLSKFIVNEYGQTFGDYAEKYAAVGKKKILTTTICLSILTTKEDEEPEVGLKIDGETKKADIPICLPKSLKSWKKENGYGEVKEKKCGGQGKDNFRSKSITNIKPFILKEVSDGSNRDGLRSGSIKSTDYWEKLDEELKDQSKPWSKFKRKDRPGNFDNQFKEATESLQKLMEAEKQTSIFITKVKFLRDNKNINEKVFERALVRTLFVRSDTSNDVISPLENNVLSYVSGKKNGGDYVAGLEHGNNDKNFIISKDINPLEPGDPDHKLNYWREDILLHVFHQFWHEINYVAYPLNRKGERFTFMHNQLFQRYNIEREMNGMSPITCKTGEEFFKPYPRPYNPQLWVRFYKDRKKGCQLTQDHIKQLKKYRSDLLSKIQAWKNDAEEYNNELELLYHNYGHKWQGEDCAVGNSTAPATILSFSEVSARDPTFYIWHCEIQRVWQKWLDVQPKYEKKDMDVDIELTKVWVESKDGNRNKLVTFMEDTTLEHKDKFTIKYHRQNHDPFTFKLTLKNTQKKSKKVMIRIYLGLSRKGENDEAFYRTSSKMIIMDRFIYALEGHKSEEVTRASSASAVTMKESGATLDQMMKKLTTGNWNTTSWTYVTPFCGWPAHLFLPRGGKGGRQYDLAVVVTDVEQNNNEGIDGVDHILCGHNNPSATVDKRSLLFPFDRPWNFKLNDVKSVKIEKITITHKDSVTSGTSGIDNVSQQKKDKWIDAIDPKANTKLTEAPPKSVTDELDMIINDITTEQNSGENKKTTENPGGNNDKTTENPGGNNDKTTENPGGNNDKTTENPGGSNNKTMETAGDSDDTNTGTTQANSQNEDCIEKDTDYYKNDIMGYSQSPKVDSWHQCSDQCRQNQKCKFWTWLGGHGKKCLVKSSNKGKRKRQGDISGNRQCGSINQENKQGSDCIENNTDYWAYNLVPYKQSPKVENWQQCSDLCRKKQQCKHWTWLKDHDKKCLIKSSNKGKRKREGNISGSRECGSKNQGNNQENNQGNNKENNQGNNKENNQENNQGNNQKNNQGNNKENNQENNQGNNKENNKGNNKENNQENNQGNNQDLTTEDCIENDTDYWANDVVPYEQSPKVDSWQQCSDLCRKNQQCKHWTWLKDHSKKCLVKSSNSGKRKIYGDISGSRDCGSKNDYSEGTGDCRTRTNQTCELPFIFQSVRYNGCITLPTKSEAKTWCSTKNDDRGHVVKKYWGYCNQNCPTDPNGEKV